MKAFGIMKKCEKIYVAIRSCVHVLEKISSLQESQYCRPLGTHAGPKWERKASRKNLLSLSQQWYRIQVRLISKGGYHGKNV